MSQPSDPPRRRLTVDGGDLAFTEEGEGPPVLAIHGLPGSVRDFRWLAPALADRVRLIRVDQPGFGESEPMDEAEVLPVARRLAALVSTLELDRPVLLGHSFGGPLAVALSGLVPARGVALLASVGLRPHQGYRSVPAPKVWGALTAWPLVGAPVCELTRRTLIRLGFSRYTTRAEAGRTMRMLAAFDFAEHAARVRALCVPTLVGWAEDDPEIEAGISTELAAACPDGPRLAFPTGGHNIQKGHALPIAEALLTLARGPGG
jgi:pimeloyl-ACP methyl ester carboxylesterase